MRFVSYTFRYYESIMQSILRRAKEPEISAITDMRRDTYYLIHTLKSWLRTVAYSLEFEIWAE